MGCSPLRRKISSSDYDNNYDTPKQLPNPDPNNFNVLDYSEYKSGHVVLLIEYPDCKNYEGKKILVYEKIWDEINNQPHLDPHFSDNKNLISPIARFEPTERGWVMANQFVKLLGLIKGVYHD